MIVYRHEIREASALTHRRDPHHMAPRLYSRPRLFAEQPGAAKSIRRFVYTVSLRTRTADTGLTACALRSASAAKAPKVPFRTPWSAARTRACPPAARWPGVAVATLAALPVLARPAASGTASACCDCAKPKSPEPQPSVTHPLQSGSQNSDESQHISTPESEVAVPGWAEAQSCQTPSLQKNSLVCGTATGCACACGSTERKVRSSMARCR